MNIVSSLSDKLKQQEKVTYGLTWDNEEINSGVAPRVKYTTPSFGVEVFYEDSRHIYFVKGIVRNYPLISVTTLIGLFSVDFDADAQSLRCAGKAKYDCNCLNKIGWGTLSLQDKAKRIKQAWEDNRIMAANYGTAAHMACEYAAVYLQMSTESIMKEILLRNDAGVVKPVIKSFIDNLRPILFGFIQEGYQLIPEPLLVDLDIGAAGQSDLVTINHTKKSIWVLDYKTNEKRPGEKHAFNKMLGFFQDYDDTDYVHYCIQLTLYAIMLLQQYPGYYIENLAILWLNRENGQIEVIGIDFQYWFSLVTEFKQHLIDDNVPVLARQFDA